MILSNLLDQCHEFHRDQNERKKDQSKKAER